MGNVRRGYVLLLTAGDREIAGALVDGVVRGREDSLSQATPDSSRSEANPLGLHEGALARVLPPEQRRVVEAEIDRQRIAWALRRDMHPVPVDYRGLAFDAEVQYGESLYERGAMQWIAEKLLVGYALVVMGFERLFRSVGL